MTTAAHKQIDDLARQEAELRAGRRRADPMAIELGNCLREIRQRLELREENRQLGRAIDTETLPLFGGANDGS